MRKPMLGKQFVQSHTPRNWQNWEMNTILVSWHRTGNTQMILRLLTFRKNTKIKDI